MHKDFHLYGTFLIAYNAGFNEADSARIACAAQAVDDFTEQLHPRHYSCQTNGTIAASMSDRDRYAIVDTWTPFHFMPCHIDDSGMIKNYNTGPRETKHPGEKLDTGILYDAVMVRVLDQYENKPEYLDKIGVTMHVLADTFAHQGFSGKLEKSNIVNDAFLQMSNGQKVRLNLTGSLEHIPTRASKMVAQLRLGHGSIGHLPDISWAYYEFKKYNDQHVYTHNNQTIFANAFSYLSEMLHELPNPKPPVFKNCFDEVKLLLNAVYITASEIYMGNPKSDIAFDTEIIDVSFATILNNASMNVSNDLGFAAPPQTTALQLEAQYNLYLQDLKKRRNFYFSFLDAIIWHRNFVEAKIMEYDADYPFVPLSD